MGNMEEHLSKSIPTALLHHLKDLWKSPRGTVLRIEALALTAIVLSFFLATFGSCRRWSNRWILQKGFLAAHSLCLSLGTYSIGLMQSSSVKSEMYRFWSVSLLTLFGCVDPVTSYSLDYKSQLWKMIYQTFLYCGYVLLINFSTISSEIGKVAIGVLSTITFIKAFHRSLAFVSQIGINRRMRRTRRHMRGLSMEKPDEYSPEDLQGYRYVFEWYPHYEKLDKVTSSFVFKLKALKWRLCNPSVSRKGRSDLKPITIDEIWQCNNEDVRRCRDVCLSYSLSNLLQRRFFGLEMGCDESDKQMNHDFVFKGLLKKTDGVHYKRAFKVIEVELAFLYDTFFTSNRFLRLNQPEAASIWAFASVIGICFVGVVALNPSMRSSSHNSGDTIIVNTTTADLIITIVILVFLVLQQAWQLIRCWTSNWARVSFVYDYMSNKNNGTNCITSWMGLKAHLTRIKCFDSNLLWQNKLGQYSFVESISRSDCNLFRSSRFRGFLCQMFGLPYMARVLRDLFGSETGHSIELHADVKESIAEFLYRNNGFGSTFLEESGLSSTEIPNILRTSGCVDKIDKILVLHIATCYCEIVQRKKCFCSVFRKGNVDFMDEEERKYHGIATALSKYYAYLLVSAPKLVGEDIEWAKSKYTNLVRAARKCVVRKFCSGVEIEVMSESDEDPQEYEIRYEEAEMFKAGVQVGQKLKVMSQRWKILADFWVEALVHAAPSEDTGEEHMRHLTQGGEFITHLWALLSHAGILKMQPETAGSGL